MKKILTLLLSGLLLAGCSAPPAETTEPPSETQLETTLPAPAPSTLRPAAERVAQLDTAPLPVIPPEERFRNTSTGNLVETESGYYTTLWFSGMLFYADKTDLTHWVVVCNRPDCPHDPDAIGTPCNAMVGYFIWEQDGKLYTPTGSFTNGSQGNAIFQVGWDGSGLTPVYSDPKAPPFLYGITVTPQYYPGGICYNAIEMQPDGTFELYLYFIDSTGSHKLVYGENFPGDVIAVGGNTANRARGDLTMEMPQTYEEAIDPSAYSDPALVYRVTPDSAEPLNLPQGCPYFGAYLSGDTMVHYHPNEGFYRLDIPSGKEVKVQDAAYDDAVGYCLDGTFLVESNICDTSTPDDPAMLRYFDGEGWTEVVLPPEITPDGNLEICGLTTEYLFFTDIVHGKDILYAVRLGENQMVKCMEYNR